MNKKTTIDMHNLQIYDIYASNVLYKGNSPDRDELDM